MQSLFHSLTKNCRGRRYQHHRGISDSPSVKHPRDRGLDHAVQREKHLKPLMNIKNLIKSEPTKSLPLSVISQQRDPLKIPIRPIDFIRRYPSVFEEFFPAGISIHPHIKLTPQVLEIDAEEQLVYQTENYKQDVANRLLKLLMLCRIDKIPLNVLDDIKWDLGLPEDYVKSLVPDFPDCFRVIGSKNSDLELELVCWSDELSTSLIEKKVKSGKMGYNKGMPIAFPMQFTKGFVVDKQMKKWFDEWQKLPYISPFENMTHLGPNTDESDKWAVGVLHELISLFVSKKVEKDTLLNLGNWLGIRPRLNRALVHHPGIFYLSSKGGTYTVVLREAYKRGLLNERSPMAKVLNQYAHLMNIITEDSKTVGALGRTKQEKKPADESKDQREKDDDENGTKETNDEDADFDDDDEEEEEDEEEQSRSRRRGHRNARSSSSRTNRNNGKFSSMNAGRRSSVHKDTAKTKDKAPPRDPNRKEMSKENFHSSSRNRLTKSNKKLFTKERTTTS